MPFYPCSDFHLENPWVLYPPLVLAIPTLILNIIVVQLLLMKKEFHHMFYRLLCLFSVASCCKWFSSLLLSTFTSTKFACNYFYDTLLKNDRRVLLFIVPNLFFYFCMQHAGILLALNRATTAITPVTAKKFWHKNEKGYMLITLLLVIGHCVPFLFCYAYLDPQLGLSDKSSLKLSGPTHRSVFDTVTILLLLLLIVITAYTKVFNKEIAKYANERNMLHTGLVLAVITGVCAVIDVLKFFDFNVDLAVIEMQRGLTGSTKSSFKYYLYRNQLYIQTAHPMTIPAGVIPTRGHSRLLPIYIILAMDPVLRNFVLQFLRMKKTTDTNVLVFEVGSN